MKLSKRCRVTWEELLDLEEGRTDAATAERLRAHLAEGCEACEAQRAAFGRAVATLRMGELTPAPEHVVSRARDLFRERFVKPARRSLFAQLVFDSRAQLAMSGARGAESGQIQALYSTDEHDVDLWQERGTDGRWYVIGQVLPKDGGAPVAPAEAVLSTAGGDPIATSGEGAEFHLSAVPAGRYTLRIVLPDAEITAVDVPIGA